MFGKLHALERAARAGDPASFLPLADLLDRRGDQAGARLWYRRALAHEPQVAANNMAALELGCRRYARALWWFDRCREARDHEARIDCAYMRYYGIGTRTREPIVGLARRLDSQRVTPFGFEEAHFLEAVARVDRGGRGVAALLEVATRDDDYPEAAAMLRELRAGGEVRVRCRCRRGRPRVWASCSPCGLHRR